MHRVFIGQLLLSYLLTLESFVPYTGNTHASLSSSHKFKQKDENENSANKESFLKKLKNFLPGIVRARIEKSFSSPKEDPGNRYQVRLLAETGIDKRHVITRIMRFFPGTSWETADDIVVKSLNDGLAVIRVFNSLNDAKYALDMMRLADPPIAVDIFDEVKGDILF